MTDLIAMRRMTQVIEALDKMHNGLLALITEHQDLEIQLNDRIKKLEERLDAVDLKETKDK